MKLKPSAACCLIVAVLAARDLPAENLPRAEDDLFAGNDVLDVTVTAPFMRMSKERDKQSEFPGTLVYQDDSGEEITLATVVQVRGNNRLRRDVCRFPPIRLIFGDDAENTLFQNQRKLKVVTQCNHHSNDFKNYLLKEYLAYRFFNEITDRSYRVRLANITYQREKGKPITRFGFFIESKRNLAARLGTKRLSTKEISRTALDQGHLNQVSLFQLMIGNVDWAATQGGNDECCHNTKLFEQKSGGILAIPYDFDYSGLVDASYAVPNTDLRQKKIKQRIYRGFCSNNNLLEENIALFNSKKAAIMSMIKGFEPLYGRQRSKVAYYMKGFYTTINERTTSLLSRCRG